MREILFRGKTENGHWAYGSLIDVENYCCILKSEEDAGSYMYPYLEGAIGTIDGRATPVFPETVGQWTGLTDKNGKKIFEGDIVYNGSGDPGIVKWFYGSFVIHFTNGDVWDVSQYIKEEYTEVIGNIHDNPELLKGE